MLVWGALSGGAFQWRLTREVGLSVPWESLMRVLLLHLRMDLLIFAQHLVQYSTKMINTRVKPEQQQVTLVL